MYIHGQLRIFLASFFVWFLFLSTNVYSYPTKYVTVIGKRGDQPVLDQSTQNVHAKTEIIEHTLSKREDRPAVLDIWDRIQGLKKVEIGKFRAFDLHKDTSDAFGTSFCYGCVIVVISSGKKLLIAHIAEQTGKGTTFGDDDAVYEAMAEGPLEDLIHDNKAGIGERPVVMVFAPTAQPGDWRKWSNFGRMQELIDAIQRALPNLEPTSIQKQGYLKTQAFHEEKNKADGKVTVAWKAPDPGSTRANLEIYAAERISINAQYVCTDDMWCAMEAYSIQNPSG